MMKLNLKKGFTLIELLVVIAIIGILSGIVLTSLGTARSKAKASAVQSQLSGMRAQAELYSGGMTDNSYGAYSAKGVCATPATTALFGTTATNGLSALLTGVSNQLGGFTNTQCAVGNTGQSAGNGTSWAVSAQNPANTANYYCVDSSGTSKESAQASAAASVTQDATSARCS